MPPDPGPGVPAETWRELEPLVARFECAWDRGERPDIDAYLPAEQPFRFAVLVELVYADLEFRRKAGEAARADDYLTRYPELAANLPVAGALAEAERRLRQRFPGPPGGAATLRPETVEPTRAWTGTPEPGPALPRIGGYAIERELGRGGMGTVHLARRIATGEPVAVKLVLPDAMPDERAVQLFLREISVLSRLDHPRIVRFHEAGLERGVFFFAMEYVEAVDLERLLAPLPAASRVKTACGIACQVLEALRYAHDRSFVHRDVKPSNVLVLRAGRKLRAKLADFGLAKNLENGGFSGLTRSGEVRGSLPFVAPEQFADPRNAGPAADVYGAGATLYWLLAATTPHDFPPGQSAYKAIEADPVPLLVRRPDLPEGLAAVVHRALAKRPDDRFPSAAALHAALLPYAKGRAGQR